MYNKYDALSVPNVTSVILDNDVTMVHISNHKTYLEESAEFKSTTSYEVALLSQPWDFVTVFVEDPACYRPCFNASTEAELRNDNG